MSDNMTVQLLSLEKNKQEQKCSKLNKILRKKQQQF